MITQDQAIPGTKVYYTSPDGIKENGIIKSCSGTNVFVVYNCANDWDNYKNYTAQCTQLGDLSLDWIKDIQSEQ